MFRCDRTVSLSCSSRPISPSLAVIAAWPPIARPVRGSALRGISGTSCPGRIRASALSRSCSVLALFSEISTRRRSSPAASGASEVVSTPPAMPESICPRAILLATRIAASKPVPQACWTSYAGVVAESLEPSTDSRVRLKSRECLRTAPATTSPIRCPWRPKRATRPSSVAVSMSWLDACAYAEFDRANGMRLPPRTAARRGWDELIGDLRGSLDRPRETARVAGTDGTRYCWLHESRAGQPAARPPGLQVGRAPPCPPRAAGRRHRGRGRQARRGRRHGGDPRRGRHEQDRRLPALRRPQRALRRRLQPGGGAAHREAPRGDDQHRPPAR